MFKKPLDTIKKTTQAAFNSLGELAKEQLKSKGWTTVCFPSDKPLVDLAQLLGDLMPQAN